MRYRILYNCDPFKKVYVCDLCDTEYKNREDAQKCENDHIRPEEMGNYKINAHQKYPHEIKVRFADGTYHWYRKY